MEATVRPPTWKTLLASPSSILSGIDLLAIRVGVREVPRSFSPACASSLPESCSTAGCASKVPVSVAAPLACRVASRSLHLRRRLRSIVLANNACLRESRRHARDHPVFMALSEIIFLRTQRLTFRLALALLVGIAE